MQIRPNSLQPRKTFRPKELAELEASIKEEGLLQPITVRPSLAGGFELIAGERRFRAATNLGWADIPAIIRDVDDKHLLSLALIENLQRADLDPLEEADGYQRLITDFKLSQLQVAQLVGKDRSTVANILRLNGLPPSVRKMLQDGHLSVGHARALLGLRNEEAMIELARESVARGLTVRDIERRIRSSDQRPKKTTTAPTKSADVVRIEHRLRRRLQTDVHLELTSGDRGSIRIAFYSADDLERLLGVVLGPEGDMQ